MSTAISKASKPVRRLIKGFGEFFSYKVVLATAGLTAVAGTVIFGFTPVTLICSAGVGVLAGVVNSFFNI
jgi:hypothetical protein